ncbi:MAG: hypothetical protein E7355_03010 [Clostridiales bacterium]|nr:hypothetical protein [Clostridiales bacterium]
MKQKSELFAFENKYPFLYDILVGGVPIYTSFRDGVMQLLQDGQKAVSSVQAQRKDGVSIKRVINGFFKKRKFRKKQTLIFTSTVYRRDNGRNLAAEYLLDHYPDGVVFEWPSRNAAYDNGYFTDVNKDKYCPLDYFSVRLKLYSIFHKKEYARLCEECRQTIVPQFAKTPTETENEQKAVAYLLEHFPDAYATTVIYQKLFGKFFKRYKNVQYAIDFWGGARENIIPVLRNNPQSIELQHGIITNHHVGYVYPAFVKNIDLAFFKRKILVYGDKTKRILCEQSIFDAENVEVIGNPRTQTYKKVFGVKAEERDLILFASQPYEQDGVGQNYYSLMIKRLKKVQEIMAADERWKRYRLAIKLHPREDNGAIELYRKELDGVEIYDNTSQLYELLLRSFVQLTVSSTSLYEAAEFGAPTISFRYNGVLAKDIYEFDVWEVLNEQDLQDFTKKLLDEKEYEQYVQYLTDKTKNNM